MKTNAILKNIFFLSLLGFVALSLSLPHPAQARRERYKSYKSDRPNSYERYGSKDKSERKRFDKNYERYRSLSPQQKRKKLKKWKRFKQETTPEEREYIMKKLRKDGGKNKKRRRFSD